MYEKLIDSTLHNQLELSDEQLTDRIECREIVKKICDYGVSQQQILMIIGMLALELEYRELSFQLTNLVGTY